MSYEGIFLTPNGKLIVTPQTLVLRFKNQTSTYISIILYFCDYIYSFIDIINQI